jgi:predicted DNA-binding WGR domain protein
MDDIWDARLNQTEISGNKNKFYILQLLHPIGNSAATKLFTRWGHVGENGQTQFKVNYFAVFAPPHLSSADFKGPWDPATAVQEFKKQFKAKAGVDWTNKKGMTAKKGQHWYLHFPIHILIHFTGKYTWLGKYSFDGSDLLLAHFAQSQPRKTMSMSKIETEGKGRGAGIRSRRKKSLTLHWHLNCR